MGKRKFTNPLNKVSHKWRLTLQVLPIVALLVVAKYMADIFDLEMFSLSPLFGAVISANVFLMGFLITGVVSDYKESEKIPGEMASVLETFVDDCVMLKANGKRDVAKNLYVCVCDITKTIEDWLYKKSRTTEVMAKVSGLNECLREMEAAAPPNYVVRLKQEQSHLRRIITRIHTIRETSFNPAAYAIVEIISTILCLGLIFARIEPARESMFFVGFVSFFLVYMIFLIKDFDNPFEYYSESSATQNVSLKPIHTLRERLAEMKGTFR